MSRPSYVPAHYRAPLSDKEYLCSAAKDNGLHRCQDLPALRSADLSTACQNALPPDWRPAESGAGAGAGGRPPERWIDGEQVPHDLVPGDEASPFLVKQLSPLIAQSVFQPAFAPRQPDSLPALRQRRRRRRRRRRLEAPAAGQLMETNANSDQFDSISQQQQLASSERPDNRRAYLRRKHNKGACINWNKYYTQCRAGETNPFQGTISFDNVGMAWTTIFLVISLEGWSDIMYLLQDSHSFWVWTYFVLLIVIGSFFMINLCLVVIATQFSATKKREMERMRQERLKFSSSSTLTAASESTNCYTVIVKYIAHCLRRSRSSLVDRLKRRKCHRLQQRRLRGPAGRPGQPPEAARPPDRRPQEQPQGQPQGRPLPTTVRAQHGRSRARRLQHPNDCPYCEGAGADISLWPRWIGRSARLRALKAALDRSIGRLVDHRYFQRLILLAILINAISMGIEYHNQPQELTEAVEISNIVFAFLFLAEMMLKLYAHGLYDYVIDGFNCFDGCIVIISILELFASTSGGSGLSVLRTFRLLRILKLVRFMPALRRQLVIMLRTLDNVAVFFGLLVLFIFIFAILGMNLFGCKFCETLPDGTERCDRKNFNSLLWSLVTVFQILTQEDWNVSLLPLRPPPIRLSVADGARHASGSSIFGPNPPARPPARSLTNAPPSPVSMRAPHSPGRPV